MIDLLEILGAIRESKDPRPLVDAIPYARFLGLDVDTSTGELLTKMSYAEHLVGNPNLPALHGGTIGALLESAAVFQVIWAAETIVIPKTITITVDYLRSGKAADTYAKGTFTKQGRRIATVQVEAWQEDRDRPIAAAKVMLLVTPPDGTDGAAG